MIVNVTVTVTALPDEGVMITVAVDVVPAVMPVTSTLKVMVEDDCAGSWPLVALNVNQVWEDGLSVHFSPLPPVLVRVMDCGAGLTPAVVV